MFYLAIITLIVSYISARISVNSYMILMSYRYGRIKSFRYEVLTRRWAYYVAMLGLNLFTFPILLFIYYSLTFVMKESLGFIPPVVAILFLIIANYFYGPRFYLAGYFNEIADQASQLLVFQGKVSYISFSNQTAGFYESVKDKNIINRSYNKEAHKNQGGYDDSGNPKNIYVPIIRTRRDDGRIH